MRLRTKLPVIHANVAHRQRCGKTATAFVQILVIRLSECASTPDLITHRARGSEFIHRRQTWLRCVLNYRECRSYCNQNSAECHTHSHSFAAHATVRGLNVRSAHNTSSVVTGALRHTCISTTLSPKSNRIMRRDSAKWELFLETHWYNRHMEIVYRKDKKGAVVFYY
jgi:hypothetical protein